MGVPITNSSLFIELKTQEYPLYLHEVKQRTNAYIPTGIDSDQLIPFGYDVVRPTNKPTKGDVITEGAPKYDEKKGYWVQVWDVRKFNEDELNDIFENKRRELLANAYQQNDREQSTSQPYTIGDSVISIRFSQDAMNEFLGAFAAADVAESDDTVIKLFDSSDNLVELPVKDVKSIIAVIHHVRVESRIKFLAFVELVNSSTRETGLPALPSTFIELT